MTIKKYTMLCAVVCAIVATSYVVALAAQAGIDHVTILIRLEQKDHYERMHDRIVLLRRAVADMDTVVEDAQAGRLTAEERAEISEKLRHIEEISLQVTQRTIYYNEDNTAHMFFAPSDTIDAYFDEVYNTPLYVGRFVRSMEDIVTVQYPTAAQKELVAQNYDLLVQELKKARSIENQW
jgi:hypothetical protein